MEEEQNKRQATTSEAEAIQQDDPITHRRHVRSRIATHTWHFGTGQEGYRRQTVGKARRHAKKTAPAPCNFAEFSLSLLQRREVMVTLLFILIAYAIRKRFLPYGTPRADRVLYYILSVFLTPILGPWVFKIMIESKPADPNEPSSMIWPYVG